MYLIGPLWKAAATQTFYYQHRNLDVRMIRHGNLKYPDPIGTMQVWSVTAPPAPESERATQTQTAG